MQEFEIQVGLPWNSNAKIAKTIESVLQQHGLHSTMKGSLRTFPGCVHWHFKKPSQSGTLEVTMWPGAQRVWLSVQSRRKADWLEQSIDDIRRDLERALRMKKKGLSDED